MVSSTFFLVFLTFSSSVLISSAISGALVSTFSMIVSTSFSTTSAF